MWHMKFIAAYEIYDDIAVDYEKLKIPDKSSCNRVDLRLTKPWHMMITPSGKRLKVSCDF